MKVLFLTHSFPRYVGDVPGSFLHRLAVALKGEDVEVRVIAPSARDLKQREDLEGIHVERFRYAPASFETLAYTGNMAQDVAGSWSARLALTSFLGAEFFRSAWERRSFDPDVIHAHWWFPSGVVAMPLASLTGKPLITTMHGTDVRLAMSVKPSRQVLRGVIRRSHTITTVSSWLASQVTEMVPEANPVIAPMPVATEKFVPHGSREGDRFLFAGRLNKQKGLDHLLRAFAAMKGLAMLDVVGHGPDEQSLRLLASQLGVSDRVTWHGQLSQPELVAKYQNATAVVVPSTDEGLGLVAAEALLCETPVIAFRSGGLTDIVRDGETGMLVTPGETGELAAALDTVLADREKVSALAKAGRDYVLEKFSPASAAKRYSTIYAQALAKQ
ncbi:MAG TPA: glycosyltransferase family 4 protein [Gemmatimonadaceae bacterium]